MKYICVGPHVEDYRIFGDSELHSVVAAEVNRPVISAGFVRFDDNGRPVACGSSMSLRIPADIKRDSIMLRLIWGPYNAEF